MKQNLTSLFSTRFRTCWFWTCFMSILLLTTLSACGGGNGSAGSPLGPGDTTANGEITLTLRNPAGFITNVIPPNPFLNLTAHVVDGSGIAVPNVVVTFTINNSSGVFSPALGNALTNSSGDAQIMLLVGPAPGAGTITAKVTVVPGQELTATTGFSSV